MQVHLTDKVECTGCSACYAICPQNCIEMKFDHHGFKHPVINTTSCINCYKCSEVCPVLNRKKQENTINKKFAAWTHNEDLRYQSTSGGIFSEMAAEIIENGGFIVAASYNELNEVEHVMIEDFESLPKLRQSKYVQSDLNDIFQIVKQFLDNNRVGLFCGTPCQISGLYNYLDGDVSNIILIDFICRGINSALVYRKWLDELEIHNHSSIENVWFKYKVHGWSKSPLTTKVAFKNGKNIVLKEEDNLFMQAYLKTTLTVRNSCCNCKFKYHNRNSDITLADYWGVSKNSDDDKGTSLVIVNTESGRRLFESIKNRIVYYEIMDDKFIDANPSYLNSLKYDPNTDEFYKKLEHSSFSKSIKEYIYSNNSLNVSSKIKRKIKEIMGIK